MILFWLRVYKDKQKIEINFLKISRWYIFGTHHFNGRYGSVFGGKCDEGTTLALAVLVPKNGALLDGSVDFK